MIQPERIIVRHLITEKATAASSNLNQYYFQVSPGANRVAVKQAIEKEFEVEVVQVNILNTKPKIKRNRMRRGGHGLQSGYKKAIVRLKSGQSLALA